MQVLALNCGSSSVKIALVAAQSGEHRFDARIENIGEPSCRMRVGESVVPLDARLTFEAAVRKLIERARAQIKALGGIQAVAHRVVHGGPRLVQPMRVDEKSLHALEELAALAPLHNPPAVSAIRIARRLLSHVPHVAVFDTAFHATLPPEAREYAIPRDLAARYDIRRYGFHGTSHAQVAAVVGARLAVPAPASKIVSCHLGNGASVAAIQGGRSVETSMGMTPMEGLVMGTRAGDLDPGIVLLLQSRHVDVAALEQLLNTRCGLAGLTGTNDMEEIERRAVAGEQACVLAIAIYVHRIRKYIGAYAAAMGGVDAIAFTAGVGENSVLVRERCLQRLEFLGVVLDEDANRAARLDAETPLAEISAPVSRVRVYVVQADEECRIARETAAVLLEEFRPLPQA